MWFGIEKLNIRVRVFLLNHFNYKTNKISLHKYYLYIYYKGVWFLSLSPQNKFLFPEAQKQKFLWGYPNSPPPLPSISMSYNLIVWATIEDGVSGPK